MTYYKRQYLKNIAKYLRIFECRSHYFVNKRCIFVDFCGYCCCKQQSPLCRGGRNVRGVRIFGLHRVIAIKRRMASASLGYFSFPVPKDRMASAPLSLVTCGPMNYVMLKRSETILCSSSRPPLRSETNASPQGEYLLRYFL